MTLVAPIPPDSDRLPWERQIGEPPRSYEAFRIYAFHVAVEHRKERRQPTRLPGYGYDHRDPAVARRTECHPDFTCHSPARPRRSHAEVKRFAVILGCAREWREPSSVTDEALPYRLKPTRNLNGVLNEETHSSAPLLDESRIRGASGPRWGRKPLRPRGCSLTLQLYRVARLSYNARAAREGPVATADRLERRKTYSNSMGATGRFLRIFGLGK